MGANKAETMTPEKANQMMAAANALLELDEETASFAVMIAENMRSWRNRPGALASLFESVTSLDSVASPTPVRRGPDKRGHYKCSACKRVFPTRRGRNVHQAHMHKGG